MPAPLAAGAAVGGAKVAGVGAAAGATSSTGSAGAKAASRGSSGGFSQRSAQLAAEGAGGGGDDESGGGGGGGGRRGRRPGAGKSDFPSKLIFIICGVGLLLMLVILIPVIFMGTAVGSCATATGSGGTAGDWATAGKLVGASTFTGDMGYRGDMLNEHLAFAELGHAGASVGDVMGNLPHDTKIRITRPDGSWVIASKMDVGSGGGDVDGHPREIDIHVKAAEKLGLPHPEAWLGLVKYKIVKGAEASGPQWGGPDTSSSGETVSSTPGSTGYVYPLAEQGQMGGGVADHMARPFGNWMSDNAVDILTHPNTDVVAVGDGVIYRQSGSPPCPSCNPAGWTLYLRSGGHNFAYMHLNSFSVHPGQHVHAGEVIGKSGTANNVDHLHFAAEGMNPETIVEGAKAGGTGFQLDVGLLKRKFGIPTDLPPIYVAASEKYGLGIRGPSVLAAINPIETNFGELANGTSSAGAGGWMQFMPATWAVYGVDGDGDGDKDPTDKFDAIYAAANYLKASGAPGNWHDAVFAYNHAEWYVDDVLSHAKQYFPYLQPGSGETGEQCGTGVPTGPANLQEAVTVSDPAKWVPVPASIGDSDEVIDARILPAATWIAKTYGLHITQGGWQPGSPSVSHGWGTAIDMVPSGDQSQAGWNNSALRLAKDLGWTPDCAASGVKPACHLVPAIHDVFYNGFPDHGDPWHNSGSAHIHIQFECACDGYPPGQHVATWVKTFPVGEDSSSSSSPTQSDRPKKKKGNKP